jgi:hypothetical protein
VEGRTSIAASGERATGVARADPRTVAMKTSENFMLGSMWLNWNSKGDSSLGFIGAKGHSVLICSPFQGSWRSSPTFPIFRVQENQREKNRSMETETKR